MTAMDVKLPYINAALSKSGKRYYYYQRKGRSVPIRHDGKPCVPDDPNFAAAYAAAKQKWKVIALSPEEICPRIGGRLD